jgi:hypothetical protein
MMSRLDSPIILVPSDVLLQHGVITNATDNVDARTKGLREGSGESALQQRAISVSR